MQTGDTTVVAFEKDQNHRGKGMNLLFADGHVIWMSMDAAQKAIDQTKKDRGF